MTGISDGTFETWLRAATRRLDSLERAMGRARVPRQCVSTVRPVPNRLAVGTPLFETDTNRTIYVNATQTGFVNAMGTAV